MFSPPTVLLATHVDDRSFIKGMQRSMLGYELMVALTVERALELCNPALQMPFGIYVVEANLGKPASEDIDGLLRIYQSLRTQGLKGLDQRLICFTATPGALEAAQQMGIRTVEKLDLASYLYNLTTESSKK